MTGTVFPQAVDLTSMKPLLASSLTDSDATSQALFSVSVLKSKSSMYIQIGPFKNLAKTFVSELRIHLQHNPFLQPV